MLPSCRKGGGRGQPGSSFRKQIARTRACLRAGVHGRTVQHQRPDRGPPGPGADGGRQRRRREMLPGPASPAVPTSQPGQAWPVEVRSWPPMSLNWAEAARLPVARPRDCAVAIAGTAAGASRRATRPVRAALQPVGSGPRHQASSGWGRLWRNRESCLRRLAWGSRERGDMLFWGHPATPTNCQRSIAASPLRLGSLCSSGTVSRRAGTRPKKALRGLERQEPVNPNFPSRWSLTWGSPHWPSTALSQIGHIPAQNR